MSCKVTYNNDDLTIQELLSSAAELIEEIIKDMKCPVHDTESLIELGLEENGSLGIKIIKCCEVFENMLLEKIDSLIF